MDPLCPGCIELRKQLAEVRRQLAAITAEVVKLKRRAGRNSSNSSTPPSEDGRRGKKAKKGKPSGKRPGGQPGHAKAERELLPLDEVDGVVECVPSRCAACAEPLRGRDPDPRRHQVSEIPQVRPRVMEYQVHTLDCTCGARTCGQLPEGVPTGCFGPRLQATLASLTGVYRVSRRSTQAFLADSFGLHISLGAISKQEALVGSALASPVREAQAFVRAAEVVHADETSWRERSKKHWLWVAVAGNVAAFLIRPSRGKAVAQELLAGDATQTVVTDRFSSYAWVDGDNRQVCWAHLIRDFTWISEGGGDAERIGKNLLRCSRDLFDQWSKVRDGTRARHEFADAVKRIPRRVHRWLEMGTTCGDEGTRSRCRGILRDEQSLWTFLERDGVEPTNNLAERAIRPAVLLRRASLGTQSSRGSRFVERMQTMSSTLRMQGRNVLDYLHQVMTSSLSGEAPPSLLPSER